MSFPANSCNLENLSNSLDRIILSEKNIDISGERIAWFESYLLEALLESFEISRDVQFLDKFVKRANYIIRNADIYRNIADYKGRKRYGFSSTKYSIDNKRVVFLVHTGQIVYPILKFVWIAYSDRTLKENFSEEIERYLNFSIKAIKDFENQLVVKLTNGEDVCFFKWEGDEPIRTDLNSHMPLNFYTSIGRTYIYLYKITKDEKYMYLSHCIANYFKKSIHKNIDGSYYWGYRADILRYPQIEDISHGAIDIDFMILSYDNGIVFTIDDIYGIIKTVKRIIYKDRVYEFLNRGGFVDQSNANLELQVGRLLELAKYDCEVYRVITPFLCRRINLNSKIHSSVLLGLAKVIKFSSKCNLEKEVL
ncbi:MAG: hypothetical protein QXX30_04550 [Candidatus Aenigmatarchaeota archaeon]